MKHVLVFNTFFNHIIPYMLFHSLYVFSIVLQCLNLAHRCDRLPPAIPLDSCRFLEPHSCLHSGNPEDKLLSKQNQHTHSKWHSVMKHTHGHVLILDFSFTVSFRKLCHPHWAPTVQLFSSSLKFRSFTVLFHINLLLKLLNKDYRKDLKMLLVKLYPENQTHQKCV